MTKPQPHFMRKALKLLYPFPYTMQVHPTSLEWLWIDTLHPWACIWTKLIATAPVASPSRRTRDDSFPASRSSACSMCPIQMLLFVALVYCILARESSFASFQLLQCFGRIIARGLPSPAAESWAWSHRAQTEELATVARRNWFTMNFAEVRRMQLQLSCSSKLEWTVWARGMRDSIPLGCRLTLCAWQTNAAWCDGSKHSRGFDVPANQAASDLLSFLCWFRRVGLISSSKRKFAWVGEIGKPGKYSHTTPVCVQFLLIPIG